MNRLISLLFTVIILLTIGRPVYAAGYFVSAKSGLVLREEPGVKNKKILTIPYKVKLNVIEYTKHKEKIGKNFAKWAKVKFNGKTGWVYSAFLTDKIKLPIYIVKSNTVVFYFPIIKKSDYEESEGLDEVVSDYNYYSGVFLKYIKKFSTQIIKSEGESEVIVKNKSKQINIKVPIKEHPFGYIFIDKKLNYKFYPGIHTYELKEYYKKFFRIKKNNK